MIARLLAALLVVTLCAAASAAEPRLLTPQDLWAIKRVGNPALSPDGKVAVFPVQQWNIEKNKSSSNLWTVTLGDGQIRQLTTAADTTEDAPMWSPDGARVAFTSKRGEDENAALYVIPIAGGEAEKIVDFPSAISAPKWLADGKSIVFATTVIPELVGKLAKEDLAAMKKEFKHRKDSKMTAKVTENRQYRYFDHYITDAVAHRLLRV